MLLTIHDANLQKIGFIDNEKQETLNFYNDTWTRNLGTASSTFEFTVSKKQLLSDTANKPLYNQLNERSFVSFKHKGQTYLFNIMKMEENERWIRCYCENLNLELINEYTNPYKADRPLSFAEYLDVFEIPQFAMVKIGVNEISDQKRTLEWEGQDTKLARLLSLANKFDAEVQFVTQLNDDSSIKQLVLNVYHKADDSHTGVGRIRGDIRLTFEKNIKSMTRKIDKTEVYTLVVPYGKSKESHEGEQEVRVYIDNLPPWEEKDDNGIVIFKQEGVNLYAPHAADLYPSTFGVSTQSNKWIRKDLEVDSDNPNVIRAAGIANLRKHAYPAITYEVDGFIDVEIGDTITIHDKGFTPALDVRARAVEQKISFSNPTNNKTTFGNFKELENRTSGDLRSVFEQMVENSRPYNILVSTDNGVMFKNNTGRSTISPTLKRGNQVINATYRFVIDGSIVSSGLTYTVKASDITKPTVITISAWVDNKEVASEEVTFVNVSDGRTPYFHTAWSYSADGKDRFTTVYPNLNLLDGTRDFSGNWVYHEYWENDGTYKGLTVKKRTDNWWGTGKTFIAPKDGTYTFSAYVKSSGNNANIIRAVDLNGKNEDSLIRYFSNNFDWTRDSFTVTLKAKDAIFVRYEIRYSSTDIMLWTAGYKWEEGSTATPWMPSASEVTTADYPQYIGHYTNYMQVDSPNPQDYTWSLIRGNDGKQGPQGIPGPKGIDGTDAPTIFVKSYTWLAGSRAYIKLTGLNAFEQTVYSRGHNVWVLDAVTHKLKEFVNCDTLITMSFNHNGVNMRLADYLSSLTDSIVVIAASDADAVDQNVRDVLNKMGGNPEFGTWRFGTWGSRTGHVFIGMSKRSDGTWPLQPRQGYEVAIQKDGSAPETGCTLSIGGIVANGADGKTQHTHIAYADTASGSGFSLTDVNKPYIGMYQDFNPVGSQNPQDYRWSKWKGSDGRDGIPGPKGEDGRTPYVHFAYADSADGQKGFSLTQTGTKRYLGVYTDFNQEDSTNPADYTWSDTAGSISVGGRNLLVKTNQGVTNWDWQLSDGDKSVEEVNVDGIRAVKLIKGSTTANTGWNFIRYEGLLRELIQPNTKYVLSFDVKPSVDVTFDATLVQADFKEAFTDTVSMNKALANQWNKVSCVLTSKETLPNIKKWQVVHIDGMPTTNGNWLIIKNIKLEEGNIPTQWTPAIEDIQDEIDSKADDALTQAQLNKLSEINSVMKAELEAKASLDTVNQWIKAYQDFVNANSADRAQAQKALADASARVVKLENNLNDMSERWNFIDNYMAVSNDGLVVGKTDNSSSILFSPNGRISMFSAGHEVMYISQGVIHIENGIFSKTIQIGRYREEQDSLNPDRNVIRYVGGS